MPNDKKVLIPQYGNSSITDAKKYIEYVIESKNLELPPIPDLCFIIHSKHLLKKITDAYPTLMVDIGSRNSTQIFFCFPENGKAFAALGEQPGASISVVILEELIALGFNAFISTGTTGHPTMEAKPTVNVGDMILVTEALIYEGTSRHYGQHALISYADNTLSTQLSQLLSSNNINFHQGRVATTDALYRETQEFIQEVLKLEALAIDMETSALFTVARFHGKRICALLYISDIVCIGSHWDVNMMTGSIDDAENTLFKLISKMADMQ